MEKFFRITVIMGIYNCADTLIEALESLEAQTYKQFKVILCNDGSNDNTLEIAKAWANIHHNYIVIENSQNLGLNATLNHCLKYADTEFIARMDGDDRSLPNRFEQEIEFLDSHPEYAIVSGPMHYFDEHGIFKKGKGKGEIKKLDFIAGSPFCHAPCMVRREAYEKVKGYTVDSKLLRVEDYHLWFKMYAAGFKGYMLENPIYEMRDTREAISRRTFKSRLNEAYVKHIGYKMIGLPWWYQSYCIIPIIKGLLPRWLYKWLHQHKAK
ncbi:glycosyltransferase family 2 protein [Phocaeicola coprocola]|uniref:glycosyltransferase family 2 protein n=1 Tax=Phocaeicola coprocola TaxID=310298 RepID=UPI00195B86FD|nr:glycosyltransferase family 2 protein [Phocaeicola coprocola]MBM6713026.1 glycosyltransferase family 2 protein [Phocaeicola coprocola]